MIHDWFCRNRAKNKLIYGYFGGKELFLNSQRYLERRIQLECDGEPVKLPQRLQGLVFLNIPSYMAGTNFWGTEKEKEGYSAPSHDDKLIEVVGITGFSHLVSSINNLCGLIHPKSTLYCHK